MCHQLLERHSLQSVEGGAGVPVDVAPQASLHYPQPSPIPLICKHFAADVGYVH